MSDSRPAKRARLIKAVVKTRQQTQKTVIFIRIHKTGTTTINDWLFPGGHYPHMLPAYIQRSLSEKEWEEAFKFTFVRNTYDRLVSVFSDFSDTTTPPRHCTAYYQRYFDKTRDQKKAFARWVQDGCISHLSVLNPKRSDQKNNFLPKRPMMLAEWLVDSEGKDYLDFIGRFESLEQDMFSLNKKLNLNRKESVFPHKNRSRRDQDYRVYYTEETKAIVDEIFQDEITKFGFQF
tara:strand:+ start:2957 stop:3658 length:702 start_codon:yes stop_codon:yes gene_type:complete